MGAVGRGRDSSPPQTPVRPCRGRTLLDLSVLFAVNSLTLLARKIEILERFSISFDREAFDGNDLHKCFTLALPLNGDFPIVDSLRLKRILARHITPLSRP